MEKLGQFVDATKQELVSFWDLCCYSQEQRDKFAAFYDEDVSESLLDTLEQVSVCVLKFLAGDLCKLFLVTGG